MLISGQDSLEVNIILKYMFKYVLYFFNKSVCIGAFTMMGLMIYALVVKEKKLIDVYDFFLDPACILCLFGCVAFFASLVGWWGPLRENVGVLTAYVWMMTIFFFVQIAFVIIIFVAVYSPEAQKALHMYPDVALNKAIIKYTEDDDLRDFVNNFQETFECCGASDNDEGYKDWTKNEYYNCSVSELQKKSNTISCSVPYSCCLRSESRVVDSACGLNMQIVNATVRAQTIYTQGCFKRIADIMRSNGLYVGITLLFVLTWMAQKLRDQIKAQRQKWNQRLR
ncbi:tetraspanin-33-like isoform X2 [Mya arenaria]|uniref:tetraspanin-33-like isoform X2 n=1 Tax=Mya arenaria TaxID=6604 RepID=UPI0022E3A09A|nr:tetraspanin-33-like isoform X2 [Mya arenaria]XP_052771563.1 tetraspanin-33-like isoform X2 [Mya arenaria]